MKCRKCFLGLFSKANKTIIKVLDKYKIKKKNISYFKKPTLIS